MTISQPDSGETFRQSGAWIVSSQGYRVRALGRAGMEYVEGDRCLHVDSEALAIPAFMVNAKSIPADVRVAVVDNLRRAWLSSGFELEVIE